MRTSVSCPGCGLMVTVEASGKTVCPGCGSVFETERPAKTVNTRASMPAVVKNAMNRMDARKLFFDQEARETPEKSK